MNNYLKEMIFECYVMSISVSTSAACSTQCQI